VNRYIVIRFTILDSRFTTHLTENARPSDHPYHRRGGGITALAFAKIGRG
jgi:hypothetical protein